MKTILFWLIVVLAMLVGWVMNLEAVFNTAHAELTGVFILRIVGIFLAPIGGVLGYI